jgi:RNA polymerase sigma-70 factor (ECF subfamily)
MHDESLRQILDAAKNGDRRAWNELVMRFQRRVFAAALAATGDMDEADEVTQEAFVRLFGKISSIKQAEAVGGWLTRTAVNAAHDRRRFRKLRAWFGRGVQDAQAEPSPVPSPEAQAARAEAGRIIASWSEARLSERERLVLQLRVGEEMTIEEIAHELEISPSAVKTHLARAREKLRPILHGIRGE